MKTVLACLLVTAIVAMYTVALCAIVHTRHHRHDIVEWSLLK